MYWLEVKSKKIMKVLLVDCNWLLLFPIIPSYVFLTLQIQGVFGVRH